MKNIIKAILLLSLMTSSCDIDNEENIPPPVLPATVYGQLPTRAAIVQTAEAVGATNVQILSYQIATSASENASGVTTNGGIQPSWWRSDRNWCSSSYHPMLVGIKLVYDETDNMHPEYSVRYAIYRLLENAGFSDAIWFSSPFEVEAYTNKGMRLIPLPTHAHVINAVEQLGGRNVKIVRYVTYSVDFWRPPVVSGIIDWYGYHVVPADSTFYATQGGAGVLWLSYEHPGLGSIITNNDVKNALIKLFKDFGFETVDVDTTGTLISTSFPLPSFSQITQAAENAGATNVQVSTYIANNVNVIPMNEGSRLVDVPIVVELSYDGSSIAAVTTNVKALFVNFNTVNVGNNAVATIPLPRGTEIRQAALKALYFPASLVYEPSVYNVNGVNIDDFAPGSAPYNARIIIFMNGDGTNDSTYAGYAANNILILFNQRGFFNVQVTLTNR